MLDMLKLFYLRKKKADVQKGIFFLFYQIVMEVLFIKKLSEKSLQITISQFGDENIVYLAFKFVLNKNQSGQLMTSHSAQLHF